MGKTHLKYSPYSPHTKIHHPRHGNHHHQPFHGYVKTSPSTSPSTSTSFSALAPSPSAAARQDPDYATTRHRRRVSFSSTSSFSRRSRQYRELCWAIPFAVALLMSSSLYVTMKDPSPSSAAAAAINTGHTTTLRGLATPTSWIATAATVSARQLMSGQVLARSDDDDDNAEASDGARPDFRAPVAGPGGGGGGGGGERGAVEARLYPPPRRAAADDDPAPAMTVEQRQKRQGGVGKEEEEKEKEGEEEEKGRPRRPEANSEAKETSVAEELGHADMDESLFASDGDSGGGDGGGRAPEKATDKRVTTTIHTTDGRVVDLITRDFGSTATVTTVVMSAKEYEKHHDNVDKDDNGAKEEKEEAKDNDDNDNKHVRVELVMATDTGTMDDSLEVGDFVERSEPGSKDEKVPHKSRHVKRSDIDAEEDGRSDQDYQWSLRKKKSGTSTKDRKKSFNKHGSLTTTTTAKANNPAASGASDASTAKASSASVSSLSSSPSETLCSSKTCFPQLRDYILSRLNERVAVVLHPLASPGLLLQRLTSTAPLAKDYLMTQQTQLVHQLQARILADLRSWVLETKSLAMTGPNDETEDAMAEDLPTRKDGGGGDKIKKEEQEDVQEPAEQPQQQQEQQQQQQTDTLDQASETMTKEEEALVRQDIMAALRDLGLESDHGPGLSAQALAALHGQQFIRHRRPLTTKAAAPAAAAPPPPPHPNTSLPQPLQHSSSKESAKSKHRHHHHQEYDGKSKKMSKSSNSSSKSKSSHPRTATVSKAAASKAPPGKVVPFKADESLVSSSHWATALEEDQDQEADALDNANDAAQAPSQVEGDENENDDKAEEEEEEEEQAEDEQDEEEQGEEDKLDNKAPTDEGPHPSHDDQDEFFLSGDLALMRETWTRWIAHWVHHAKLLIVAHTMLPTTLSHMTQVAIQGGNILALDQRHWAWNLDKALATVLVEAEWLCGVPPSSAAPASPPLSEQAAATTASSSLPRISATYQYHAQLCIDAWSNDLENILKKAVIPA